MTDAAGRVTTYAYDALGRRTQTFNPAIQSAALVTLGYTPDGLLASLGDAAGHTTSYTPDGLDRLGTTTFPDGSTETLGYDANGNLLTRKTRRGDTIAFTWDTLNRLATKAAPGEATVSYGWDLAGRITSVGDTSGAITAPTTTASYAANTTWDAMNRPRLVSWSPAATQTAPAASTVAFAQGYDSTNRRVSQTVTDNTWWSYPAAVAGSTAYTANNLNQYSAVGTVHPTYDGNGNLTFDGVFTYGYDAESRLTSVKRSASTAASYAYDAQGRRKSKTAGATTTIFVTDADNREVLEYDGSSGAVQRWYAFGQGPDAVINQMNVAAGTRETMIPDVQGSIIGTLDSGGSLSKSGYQPYGENPAVITGAYRYTARRFDPETAGSTAQPSGLYYNRARIYSPTWGRFLQPDPIGYVGGSNLYAYGNNDPLNNTDPSGLDTLQAQIGLNLAFGVGPFSLSGTFSLGVAVDAAGNVGIFVAPGGGGALGAKANISVGAAYSNAATIKELTGTFANGSIGAAAGPGVSADVFTGQSAFGTVVGAGGSYAVGIGAAATVMTTNTQFLGTTTFPSSLKQAISSFFATTSPEKISSTGPSTLPPSTPK